MYRLIHFFLHLLQRQLYFRFLIILSWREYVSLLSALMQQIKIANMNANEPAMTKISPMNAGMLVGLGLVSVFLYKPVFWFQFCGIGA